MKKRIWPILIGVLLVALLTGCSRRGEPRPGETFICYANTEGTGLVERAYEWQGDTTQSQIENAINTMRDPEESVDYKAVIPEEVEVTNIVENEEQLDLHFNEAYNEMDKPTEVLCRAAIVQTLTQIEGVNQVQFFVGDTPLHDGNGQEIGYMRADDFVQNTGPALSSYQQASLSLFYPNENGDKLVQQTVNLRYNSNMTIEKAIVEQLISGPKSTGAKSPIPPNTKLLGISVKDGICYVNFNEGFLTAYYDVNPNIALQSIVNSIMAGGNATQVQISVNGETNVMFQGTVDLSKPISGNLDALEETN